MLWRFRRFRRFSLCGALARYPYIRRFEVAQSKASTAVRFKRAACPAATDYILEMHDARTQGAAGVSRERSDCGADLDLRSAHA